METLTNNVMFNNLLSEQRRLYTLYQGNFTPRNMG